MQIQRRKHNYLKKSHRIGDVVSCSAQTSDSNLVRINRRLPLRLLHTLVLIHLNPAGKKKIRRINYYSSTKIPQKWKISDEARVFVANTDNRKWI